MRRQKRHEVKPSREFMKDGGALVFSNAAGGWTVLSEAGFRIVTDAKEAAAFDVLFGPREVPASARR